MAKNENEEVGDVFNLDKTEASSYLEQKAKNDDGLLRPKLEEGKDGTRSLVIRFLPNLMKTGKIGPTAIEKHIHYADFKQNPELAGYFDCLKNVNIGKECPLCKAFWALKNTKDPKDEAKAKLISRSTKYYSYVYVVEDTQKPENEGKIMIFPFGFKIFQKIKAMKESKRNPCTVEDLVHGANFELIITEVAGYYNYDQSKFETPGPIEIGGTKLKVNDDGTIEPKHKEKIKLFLKSREHDLDDFMPKDWTDEQHTKAEKIIGHLSGNFTSTASDVNYDNKKGNKSVTSAAIFGEDDEDENETKETTKKVTATTEAKVKKVTLEDDDETETAPKSEKKEVAKKVDDAKVSDAKKKAAKFFDEDED